jgi:prepilin-type N-terminal cleavage/methylation domain-containing protein
MQSNAPRSVTRIMLRPAFTLVEMLVVIAIIGVLVTMLLPTLSSTRELNRTVDCGGRQRQMAIMTFLYNQDNNQWWPIHYGAYTASSGVPGYRAALNIYYQFTRVGQKRDWGMRNPMICPNSKSMMADSTTFWGTPGFEWPWDGIDTQGRASATEPPTSYTMNPNFYEGGYGGVPANKPRRGMPAKPFLTLLYADGWREARPHYWYVSDGKSFFRFRHFESGPTVNDGIINFSFTDGSVKKYKFELGGPIYPKSGNGLYTTQTDFTWSPMP